LGAYFITHGQEEYYRAHVLNFRPSGRRYSGSNESGVFIVGGAAVALFGVAGWVDTLRRNKDGEKL
jgi:hypothetical protein